MIDAKLKLAPKLFSCASSRPQTCAHQGDNRGGPEKQDQRLHASSAAIDKETSNKGVAVIRKVVLT